jgi:ribonuclease PH
MIQRHEGRATNQIRSIKITCDVFSYAPGTVLFELENTKVLCTVSLQPGVPPFLRNKGAGWLTAEYALLPHATTIRTAREGLQRNGRSVEISRVIGRSLRTVVDLSSIVGEKTIYVDCDVLQADGGTRAVCIIAASLAIERAQAVWLSNGLIKKPLLKERIAAISVGVIQDQVLLDPDFKEDLLVEADFTFIMTESGRLVEIQGGAEKSPISWEVFENVRASASGALAEIFREMDTASVQLKTEKGGTTDLVIKKTQEPEDKKVPLFSLQNRLATQIKTP